MPKRNASSLRWMLIDRLLPAMLGLLVVGAVLANWVALRAATKAYDRGLLDTAFAIAEQLQIVEGRPQLPLTQQARTVLLTDKFDRVFYAVHDETGELLDGNPELPTPPVEDLPQLASEGRWYYDGTGLIRLGKQGDIALNLDGVGLRGFRFGRAAGQGKQDGNEDRNRFHGVFLNSAWTCQADKALA